MGNCFKTMSQDDVSLLQDSSGTPRELSADQLGPPPPYQESVNLPIYHTSPAVSRPVTQLSEDEQVKIAQRMGLIQHLPTGIYDGGGACVDEKGGAGEKGVRECAICMGDLIAGDPIRYLPCLHIYHRSCIDDWLMRSFTCPSCMEPVDAALLTSYQAE